MNKIISTLVVSVFSMALAAPLYAQTPAPGAIEHGTQTTTDIGKVHSEHRKEHKEHHPEIHHAIHALEKAKEHLQHAAHDYDGHRAKALEHVEAALQELHLALEAAEKK